MVVVLIFNVMGHRYNLKKKTLKNDHSMRGTLPKILKKKDPSNNIYDSITLLVLLFYVTKSAHTK